MEYIELEQMALKMRSKILDISYRCGLSAHIGGGLSIVEIMTALYGTVMRFDPENPRWEERDRFILSKGHGVLGYFAALLVAGVLNEEQFATFQTNESDLIAHPVMNLDIGIESSNGSLGHGLSMAIGIALAAKMRGKSYRAIVLMGDGECNEGSVWEAVMLAPQLGLDNLIALVDFNRLQSDGDSTQIIDFGDLGAKFKCFGWDVYDIDGHDLDQIIKSLSNENGNSAPKMIVARTVKGKGISFMENNNEWHHNRLTQANFELALAEIGKQDA
jgi:transketolase